MNDTTKQKISEIRNILNEFEAFGSYSHSDIQDLTLTIESVLAIEPNETAELNIQKPITFETDSEMKSRALDIDDFAKSKKESKAHNFTLSSLQRARYLK